MATDRFNSGEFEAARKENALNLLNGMLEGFSLLTSEAIAFSKKHRDDLSSESPIEALENTEDSIATFLESGPHTITLLPRRLSNTDKIKFVVGQHAGVTVQYVSNNGLVLRVNFYGALRDPTHHLDMHDHRGKRSIHSDRTIDVHSQDTFVGAHMLAIDDNSNLFDFWLKMNQKELKLHTFTFDQTPYDVGLRIGERRFKETYSTIDRAMRNLALMVPNPYSPR